MKTFLKENGIEAVDWKNMLKRDNFEEFVKGVIEKCERNKYSHIYEMEDIVRGRVNTKSWEDVEKLSNNLKHQQLFPKPKIERPKRSINNSEEYGYPRYHVNIKDPKAGLVHEWQIGTKAITEVFERKGIKIPKGFKLRQGLNNDLHDIEYDFFRTIDKKYNEIAQKFGISDFRKRLDVFAGKAGKLGEAYNKADLYKELNKFHAEAGEILEKLLKQRSIFDRELQKHIDKFFIME